MPRELRMQIRHKKQIYPVSPGGRLRIGRSADNDVVLDDNDVSRLHATVLWVQGEDRPFVRDEESANGVVVNGFQIEGQHHLPEGSVLEIGNQVLSCELVVDGKKVASDKYHRDAVTPGDSSGEFIFDPSGPKIEGSFSSTGELYSTLLSLEKAQRTGTFKVTSEAGSGALTLAQGKVMEATFDRFNGLPALERLAALQEGHYVLTPVLKPSDSFLDLSLEEFLSRGF